MPPELWDVLDVCATTKNWKTRGRKPEPDLAGARDRGPAARRLRRRPAPQRDQRPGRRRHPGPRQWARPVRPPVQDQPDRRAGRARRAARSANPRRCPVTVLRHWTDLAGITDGPLFRPVSKGNRPLPRRLSTGAVNDIVQTAVQRAGIQHPDRDPQSEAGERGGYSAHSLRAGFVTYAHTRGASDRAIAHQTRHRSLSSVGTYVRNHTAWEDNAATQLGL